MLEERHIFISVGGTANSTQEDFVLAVEERLRAEGFIPHTVGRNTFSSDAPFKAILNLLKTCSGTMVIALERSYFSSGLSKRGGPYQTTLSEVRLPTPWNQIEAAIAHSMNLPLMVIVEVGLQQEGLLERGYDWYVQEIALDRNSLMSREFNGVLASWKEKVLQRDATALSPDKVRAIEKMSIAELVGSLKPTQLWSVLTAIGALIAGAFALGLKLHITK